MTRSSSVRALWRLGLPLALLCAGLAASSAGAETAGDPPTNTTRPSVTGIAVDGEVLQASAGTWTGSGPLLFAYQWQRCSTTPGSSNVALGRRAWASSELPSNPPAHAIDGNAQTWWSSGAFVPQWIELDLGAPHTLRTVRLTASQSPAGFTRHVVLGRGPAADDPYRLLSEFHGVTSDGMQLETQPLVGPDVQFLVVETFVSPSWVAWREIEAFAECVDMPGRTQSTYTLAAEDVGSTIRVAVTANNAAGAVTAVSERTAEVAAVPPESLSDPIIDGVARPGELLTASTGAWRGTEPIEFTFHWQRCNRVGDSCVDLVDAGEIDTLVLGGADVGKTIRVRVSARNEGGESDALSPPTALVRPVVGRCVVPNVRRKRLAAARVMIRRAGCRVGRVRRVRSRRARGRVVSQSPRPGVSRARGARIDLVVGR